MNQHFSLLARPNIQGLVPYQTARSIAKISSPANSPELIQLASNENPLGPSNKVKACIEQSMGNLWRYPDATGYILKSAIANRWQVDMNGITIGNGSAEVIAMIIQTFVEPEQEVIISKYAYAFFETSILTAGGKPVVTPDLNWGHDLMGMLSRITNNTKLVLIANPNNPTGTYITQPQLQNFLQCLPNDILVIVDEAYFEYVIEEDYADTIALQKQYANLIITRSFSKAYGLAGLRIGYSISDPEIAELLNRSRLSFNANSIALYAAAVAIEDREHVTNVVSYVTNERHYLLDAIKQCGVDCLPATANFIALKFAWPSQVIFDQLLKQRILVRQLLNYQMPNILRVTIGTHSENAAFLLALKNILASEISCNIYL